MVAEDGGHEALHSGDEDNGNKVVAVNDVSTPVYHRVARKGASCYIYVRVGRQRRDEDMFLSVLIPGPI